MNTSEKRLADELRDRFDIPDTVEDAEVLIAVFPSTRARVELYLALRDLRRAVRQELSRLKNWLLRRN